jgi:hypothetical protein
MTTNRIQDAIEAVQDVIDDISSIKAYPDYAGGAIISAPFAFVLPASGHAAMVTMDGDHSKDTRLTLLVLTPFKDMTACLKTMIPIGDQVMDNLMIGDTLNAIWTIDALDWEFGPVQWQGTDCIGWTFTVTLSNWEDG